MSKWNVTIHSLAISRVDLLYVLSHARMYQAKSPHRQHILRNVEITDIQSIQLVSLRTMWRKCEHKSIIKTSRWWMLYVPCTALFILQTYCVSNMHYIFHRAHIHILYLRYTISCRIIAGEWIYFSHLRQLDVWHVKDLCNFKIRSNLKEEKS